MITEHSMKMVGLKSVELKLEAEDGRVATIKLRHVTVDHSVDCSEDPVYFDGFPVVIPQPLHTWTISGGLSEFITVEKEKSA